MAATLLSSRADYAELLEKYDTWMFDCDGVLWSGDHVIPGITETLALLRSHSEFIYERIKVSSLMLFVRETDPLCDE
jgi:hypothetical protein